MSVNIMKPRVIKYTKKVNTIPLIVAGQGVFMFENTDNMKPTVFYIYDKYKSNGLKIEFTTNNISVYIIQSLKPLVDPSCKQGILLKYGVFYWISLDAKNQKLMAGFGEARIENVSYTYHLTNFKTFLESLTTIAIADESVALNPLRLVRDPITAKVPLLIKDVHELTMEDIAKMTYLPRANLSTVAQQLYTCIAGERFVLDTDDFPDFSKAIERSIITPGLWCYNKLQDKSREFNKDKPNILETYLRITLGQNNGESPGIPYVMEIWPVGHYSPVHNHGGADAVIRVLHGGINVALFPFLCNEIDSIPPFGKADFKKGDITWISPSLNQVHQLTNLPTNKETCITIQCYMYESDDTVHYNYFDYLDDTGNKQQYEPDSDKKFIEFKALMKQEWDTYKQGKKKPCLFCWK